MFEGLDKVDWASLEHAYGSASDVPDLLRALRSGEAEAREAALWHLYGNIFHQGTRYEASAHAVPFLLDLVADDSVIEREDVLLLLVHLAAGYPDEMLPEGLDAGVWRRAQAEAEEPEDSAFLAWYVAAYEAVRRGVPIFRQLLSDPEPGVRRAAAYALAWFREDAAGSVVALRAFLEVEDDEPMVANALLSLGMLAAHAGRADEDTARILAYLGPDHPVMVRAAAGIAALNTSDEPPPRAIGALLAILRTLDPEQSLPLLWNDGDLVGYIVRSLGALGATALNVALPTMLAALSNATGMAAFNVTTVLLGLLFPDGQAPRVSHELSAEQREFLDVLGASPRAWLLEGAAFGNFSLLLGSFGLPTERQALLELLKESCLKES